VGTKIHSRQSCQIYRGEQFRVGGGRGGKLDWV